MLYNFSVTSFVRCKKHMICLISVSKFSDVFPAFTCGNNIGNLWSICLGVNILGLEWLETRSQIAVPSVFIGNVFPSKAPRTLSLLSERLYKFLRISFFSCFFSGFCGFAFF